MNRGYKKARKFNPIQFLHFPGCVPQLGPPARLAGPMMAEIVSAIFLLHSQEKLFHGLNYGLDAGTIVLVAWEVAVL